MNNFLGIKTPAESQAGALKSQYGLSNHGLTNLRQQYWNLPTEALYEEIIFRGEGRISHRGPVITHTGEHTARAANDKLIVKESTSEESIWWGEYNVPYDPHKFAGLLGRLQGFLQGRDLFVQDCFAGADPRFRLPVRIINELAWHTLFARNMFILPEDHEEFKNHVPEFTVLCVPSFQSAPSIDGTRSNTFIIVNFEKRLCIIGNSAYAGEIKKSIFTVLNYLLPLRGVMAMHCSANVGEDGDTALFFGLSGTGKTTLSADPDRGLIGDDEHGWSDEGVFNFEGGCYAKVIRLSASAEPQIHACTQRFGTILENVVYDPVTRRIDLNGDTITENTRASYPLEFVSHSVREKMAGHPKHIILLTCDATGVMPPIAKLNNNQAVYQFISGYTSKIAGTEVGVGKEPQVTFSTCFGAPFMVHHPYFYAELLKKKMLQYKTSCWLVNTGWIGGPYGVGKRISIGYTRALLNAVLRGSLQQTEFVTDPVFGYQIPKRCDGIPGGILNPASSWSDKNAYDRHYRELAASFIDNFKKFEEGCPAEIIQAGPRA